MNPNSKLFSPQRNQMIMEGRQQQQEEEEEEEEEYYYNTRLGLGIVGSHEDHCNNPYHNKKKNPPIQFHILFPPKPQQQSQDQEQDQEDDKDKGGNTRKKLKLTEEQSILLEHSFREHHTINQTQKQQLADRLNLRRRQVEVWFQNRRARNKLKQTEVDCEMLTKWWESLRSENKRLKRELEELRSAEPPPTSMRATCPPYERDAADVQGQLKLTGG